MLSRLVWNSWPQAIIPLKQDSSNWACRCDLSCPPGKWFLYVMVYCTIQATHCVFYCEKLTKLEGFSVLCSIFFLFIFLFLISWEKHHQSSLGWHLTSKTLKLSWDLLSQNKFPHISTRPPTTHDLMTSIILIPFPRVPSLSKWTPLFPNDLYIHWSGLNIHLGILAW